MIYTSSTISLAVLELLVHLQEASLLSSYSLISAIFDDAFVERLNHSVLSDGWRADPAPSALQRIGDEWIRSQRSAVLEVPSVIVARDRLRHRVQGPEDRNTLLHRGQGQVGG
jgi:RES domain-containing protein